MVTFQDHANNRYVATFASKKCVLLPVTGVRNRDGIWIYASCRKLALLANHATGYLSRIDYRAVPGRRQTWLPPMEPEQFARSIEFISRGIGRRIESWVVQLPRDPRRRRFGLLLLDRDHQFLGFAKFERAKERQTALEMQRALTHSPPRLTWVPALLDHGAVDEWAYTVTSVMPSGPHRPAVLDVRAREELLDELRAIISANVPGAPEGLIPIHGDFGPWNVRQLNSGQLAVLDWEEAGWGPRGTDELWYSIQTNILGHNDEAGATNAVASEVAHWDLEIRSAAIEHWLAWLDGDDPDEIGPGAQLSKRQTGVIDRVRSILLAIRS